MSAHLQQEYFVNEVMTAPPQRLQLMLIEGAIRFIHRARKLWEAGQDEQAGEAILRSQEIVTQLIAGTCSDEPTSLARKVRSVYNFIHRTLVTAHVRHDEQSLAEALRVLEIERETWQQVCQRLTTARAVVEMPNDMPMAGMSFQA